MDDDRVLMSRASADAVAVAMDVLGRTLPEASEAGRLLLIMANAAVSCARLRVEREDVLALVMGAFDQGARMKEESSLFSCRAKSH
jgi:hypothetical protein